MANIISGDLIHQAMLRGLDEHIREALRKRFEANAKEIIDKAIDDSMKTFRVTLNRYRNPASFEDVVNILLKDARNVDEPKYLGYK